MKHILLNFEESAGVTYSQNIEHCLGIVWNFESDMLTPGMAVYLSKKVRGAHIGQPISFDSIADTVPTQRVVVVLCVLGSLHDLICSARIVYCEVCKSNVSKKWDVPVIEPATLELVKDLFHSIVKVKETLAPMPRAWVPE